MTDKNSLPAGVRPGAHETSASSHAVDVPIGSAVPVSRGHQLRLVGLVILKRIRFIAILALVGVFIGYWDTVMNYWEKWTQPAHQVAQELEPGYEFYCPMDPQVVRSTYEPNGDVPKCPICGMPLSQRRKGAPAPLPAGVTGRVQLSPERIQLAGIQTVPVDYRPMTKQTKTVGYVTFDETRLSRIVSRVDGYVEKLHVDETYQVVHKGDPLAEIYSPELYSTARELVLASRSGGIRDLADAARNKLLLLGVSPSDIDAIVASGQPSSRLVIRSPQEGYVVEKKIVVGAAVEARMTLFEVADLSTVWVEADVYEKDIAFLQPGQQVTATVEAYPNRVFTGELALVYPRLETATRTNRVRLRLANARHELRPGMFASVSIDTPLEDIEPFKSVAVERSHILPASLQGAGAPPRSEFPCVPERAVVDTGSRKVVYVEREPGLFEGVEVELGPRSGDYYPVLKGLQPGDQVAAAGAFLIDAETRLNPAAAATYYGASGGPQAAGRAPAAPPAQVQRSERTSSESGKLAAEPPGAPAEPGGAEMDADAEAEILASIQQLPAGDRQLARAQRVCPVTGAPLGSMGVPVKIMLRGRPVFLCCQGCAGEAKRDPDETLKKLPALPAGAE